jgi:parallel beta-helix repeat protein
MRALLLLAVLSLLAPPTVSAAHFHLRADGSGDYADIQAAVTAATSGDTIFCADGTYTGTGNYGIDFGGKNLILRSESNQPKYCIIDCDGEDRGFYFHSGEASSAVVQGFTIEYGYASSGGGISIVASSPTIMNCVIAHCSADDGGGIYINDASANPGIFNCLVSNCTAYGDGGGIRVSYCNGQIRNCTIVSNTCTGGAGGISSLGGDADIVDNIIYWNFDDEVGGAFYGLFANNLIEGYTGGGGFDGNAAFVSGIGGSYYLDQASSDAVDEGSVLATAACYPSAEGTTCMSAGWTTRTNQQEDIGSLDLGYHYPHYGANIDVPSYKATIQAAIDAAWNGDVVRVADGTYTGDGNRDLDTRGKRITVQSLSGNASACIIDCQGSAGSPHRGFYIRKGEGNQTVITNLKIINGWSSYGGGINVSGCSPTIQGCILSGNHATVDGGGIMNSGGAIAVTGCTFLNNTADDAGGGMLNHTCSPILTNCLFQSNSGYYGGGGIHNYHASPTINSCTFKYNIAPNGGGGGLHNDGSVSLPVLNGCIFQENEAVNGAGMYDRNGAHPALTDCDFLVNTTLSGGRGGGVYGNGSSLDLTRCWFAGNEAYVDGGGLYCTGILNATIDSCIFDHNVTASGGGGVYFYDHVNSMMTNSTFYQNESPNGGALWLRSNCSMEANNNIFWDNRATTAGSQIGIDNACTLWMGCNDVEYGQTGIYVNGGSSLTWGSGNIDADPLFCVAGVSGDFTIFNTSPCAPANSGGCGLIGAEPVACTATDVEKTQPAANRLHQSYPNPFNPTTKIAFDLKTAGPVSLKVFDVSGRLVRVLVDRNLTSGRHEIIWDGKDEAGAKVASGAYFCRMSAGSFTESKKLVLLR